jgi:hypothetical protein
MARWLVVYGWRSERWPEGGRVFRNPLSAWWCAARVARGGWDYVHARVVPRR